MRNGGMLRVRKYLCSERRPEPVAEQVRNPQRRPGESGGNVKQGKLSGRNAFSLRQDFKRVNPFCLHVCEITPRDSLSQGAMV